MLKQVSTPELALKLLKTRISRVSGEVDVYANIADYLEIHYSHVYNYYEGLRGVSPTLRKALIEKGLIKKRIRSQITWESEEQKQAVLKYIKRRGYKTLTEYLRDIAKYELAGDEYIK